MLKELTLGLVQFYITPHWAENMDKAEALIEQAARLGADLAILPEMFTCPYETRYFSSNAERIEGGRTTTRLARLARRLGLHILGGTIPERDGDRLYNTATLFDHTGRLIARHRKVHLFDVDLPGGVSVRESAVFSPGEKITVVQALGMDMGIAVCYDLRFGEMFRLMALAGASLVAAPAAFNNVSGPAHWELTLRARAVENTIYVAGVSGLAPPGAKYNSYGHSMAVDPFAEVLIDMGRAEGVGLARLDPKRLADIRARLPVLAQRREGLYQLKGPEAKAL